MSYPNVHQSLLCTYDHVLVKSFPSGISRRLWFHVVLIEDVLCCVQKSDFGDFMELLQLEAIHKRQLLIFRVGQFYIVVTSVYDSNKK